MIQDANAYYYFFSTTAQTLAALLALLGAFYLLAVQLMPPRDSAERQRMGANTIAWLAVLVTGLIEIAASLVGILLTPFYLRSDGLFYYTVFVGVLAVAWLVAVAQRVASAIDLFIHRSS